MATSGRGHSPSVAPFTGAWIEIVRAWHLARLDEVAPFTGAWIEMIAEYEINAKLESRPSRARGLK